MKPANETRVQIRTSEDEKAYLVKAAHRGDFKTLSTPVEPRQLSAEDSLIFANSILNPKEPNEKLKALFLKDNEEILKELLAQDQKKAAE